MNRREFLQIMAAAYLVGLNKNVFGRSSANYNYGFNSDIRLLHITDTHAQLNPSYFREPNIILIIKRKIKKWIIINIPPIVGVSLIL